jgi:aminopeptidase N
VNLSHFRICRPALLAGTCLFALGARAEAPFDFDHTPGRLPKTVVPSGYRIDIVPDVQKLTLVGHETVEIDVRQPTATMTLNQAGLTLGKAVLEDGSAAKIAEDEKAQLATLTFASPVAAGRHTLTIDYSGPIPNSPAGLYYDDYKTEAGKSDRMLVTQFEVADARRMFPGWDEPAFKATFELSAVVPEHFATLSNMPVVATSGSGAGLKKVQFAKSPRMSTYLLAFVAGDMDALHDTAANTALAVWTPRGESSQGAYALAAEKSLLPFYNDYFGVAYPLPKLDLIAIPGNYEAGAMENWGAITFIDDALLFDPKSSSAATKETIYIDTAHEMAHQWSGDLVTMGWWDNIWLNEGFATWMEYKATDHFNPSWQLWPRQHAAREGAMAQDAQPTTHPIQQVIKDETQAETAFDGISYEKGSQIIRMIEDWIGPDTFRDGMRAYMKAHAYGNATSADLWAALGAAAHKDVASVAAGFTEQPGVPLVHETRRCVKGHGTVTLTEDRFVVHDPKAKALTWQIPVTLGFPNSGTQHVLLTGAPATLPLDRCDAPLKANLGENGYFRTEYDTASMKPLAAAFGALSVTDKVNLLGDQYALFKAGRQPLEAYLDLASRVRDETNIAIWDDTLDHLEALDALARGASVRPAFHAFARGLIRPEFDRLGWDAKPGESFLDTRLRPRLIAALGEFDDSDVVAEAQRRFAAYPADAQALPPGIRGPVLTIVGHRADQATWEKLRALGEAAPSTEEKLRYFGALAASPDPKLIAETIQFAESGAVPAGRIPMIVMNASQDSDNPDEVWRQVVPQQGKLRTNLTEESQTFLLPAASVGSTSTAVARALMAEPASRVSPGAKIEAARAADVIATNAELRQRAVPALTAWLAVKR